jgi:hypothetical protein
MTTLQACILSGATFLIFIIGYVVFAMKAIRSFSPAGFLYTHLICAGGAWLSGTVFIISTILFLVKNLKA